MLVLSSMMVMQMVIFVTLGNEKNYCQMFMDPLWCGFRCEERGLQVIQVTCYRFPKKSLKLYFLMFNTKATKKTKLGKQMFRNNCLKCRIIPSIKFCFYLYDFQMNVFEHRWYMLVYIAHRNNCIYNQMAIMNVMSYTDFRSLLASEIIIYGALERLAVPSLAESRTRSVRNK
jgi:hypothetical protein